MELDRTAAVDRVEALVETVESEPMAVPVREIWVFGDLALGKDPVDRLDVYLTKDLYMESDEARSDAYYDAHGVRGVGTVVDPDWAERFPEHVRANEHGHVAPERCLAAHLLETGEPIHLEVCNASFEDNVTQRLRGARLREDYTHVLDPRGVCLWIDGVRSPEAFEKLRESAFAMPTLATALEMLEMDPDEAAEAAETVSSWREGQEGTTVRTDVV